MSSIKAILRIIWVIPVLSGQAAAEPIKCIVGGKTFYTDDPARCPKGSQKPIDGNLTILSFPKEDNLKQDGHKPALDKPTWMDNLTLPDGLSKEDLERGWQTIMDARKRGSWQVPSLPDDEKQ